MKTNLQLRSAWFVAAGNAVALVLTLAVAPAAGIFGDLAVASVEGAVSEQESKPAGVSFFAPEDAGTPRDAGRIVAVGQSEFRIRACVEEGRSVLTHAVSRVDLICRNRSEKPQEITLHLDLSDDGRRTNADNNAFGGMSTRDFIFIQPPGQPWRQIKGSVAGWVCTVRFSAPPGATKIGLNPWYTYGDYLHFVQSLPEHPHLRKTRIGASDGGREHWELTITDPCAPLENKRTIFWHAREHAYETFSSYAMEGLVTYLLSDAAAEARRHYRIVLHPMTNVDGVAQGYEYRSGYDFPQPRGTATGKLTFDAIDRLRPHFAVAWHNWVAPRDVDCLFYTDSEHGKASRRTWDLFTQRFPSPRGVGHRWESETNPLVKNWFGRTLRESNLHEYAMKRYGTQVWGWEMPWWGRDVDAARKAGADFGRAFLATLDIIAAGSAPAVPEAAPVTVPRWEMHEFELHGSSHVASPFRDAAVVGEFTSPSGKKIAAEGFYDGGATWRLRFTPDEEGEWRYLLRGEGAELHQQGRLRCTAPRGHGFIRVHPDNPYAFAYTDDTPFFPMGDTCYGLYSDSPITPALRAQYLQTRRSQRFNFVRLGVLHSPTRGQIDPNYWPWGGTPEKPDLDCFNPAFFRGFDAMLAQMQAEGMNAELIVLNYYLQPFTNVKIWTSQRERQWLRYVTARYAAFPNLFLWTIANEYETHPEGRYRLDDPGDPDWAKATARFIKQHDPYRHPVTVHPVVSASTRGSSPHDPFDPPWRIGEFFGKDDAMDVLSQQTGQSGAGVVWDEQLQCWTGDAPDLVASLRADRRYGKPVLNTESGYEYLRGHPTERKQVHHTDKVRHSAWRIVCAGGYFAAGFHGTIGHSDSWNRIDAPNHYAFVVKDEGAAQQLGLLYDFFTSLPFWRMQPFDGVKGDLAVALAEPGRVYVIYLPHGGEVTVDLSGVKGPFATRWFNPRSGDTTQGQDTSDGAKRSFHSPFEGDAVLYLEARRARQFILVNRTPGAGGGRGRPAPDSSEGFQEVKQALPDVPGARIRIGVGHIFSYLQAKEDASLLASLRRVLQSARETDTPVLIQIDGEQWWGGRPDLWNWWDPSRPGFDPANRENVEWSGWTPEHALKIAWRNWGRQLRVLPPPNLMSPRYRQACHEKMALLIPAVLDWWKSLPAEKQDLLVGIKVGWESSIGVNAWYYPNGNDLLDKPAGEDPASGLKNDAPPVRGVAPIGYAAVKTAGLRDRGELTEADLAEIARRHLEDLSRVAARLGVPRDRLFTHGAGWKDGELLYRAAVNPFSCPGWSFYRHAPDPRQDLGVQEALKGSDAPWWAATEWLYPGPREFGPWRKALENTLADRKCRYLCIYNWEGIRDSAPVLEAIRQTVAASVVR